MDFKENWCPLLFRRRRCKHGVIEFGLFLHGEQSALRLSYLVVVALIHLLSSLRGEALRVKHRLRGADSLPVLDQAVYY
jgi:hypothetical protein